MTLGITQSVALLGLDGAIVTIEVDIADGIPMYSLLGLPDAALSESRDRVRAALSQATLVVEAAFRSGSLRTARDAAELMRPVMAIPGPINAPTSEGCHRLIGERAAEIVTSVADAIELTTSL
jgi:hypothetical protein